MSEVVITSIITSASTLGGVFLGSYLRGKIELERSAKECYFKYIVPLRNSLEDLGVAISTWLETYEKYKNVPENNLDEKEKAWIKFASASVDEKAQKFVNILETFRFSEAPQVLKRIKPDLEELIFKLSHVMVTTTKYFNLQESKKTILIPKTYLETGLINDLGRLGLKLNELTFNDFIKAYKKIFG